LVILLISPVCFLDYFSYGCGGSGLVVVGVVVVGVWGICIEYPSMAFMMD